jgi:hypothetical protein
LIIIDRLPVGLCGCDHLIGNGRLSANALTQRHEQAQQLA